MSENKKTPFWRDVLEAMVIRPRAFEDKPKIAIDSFGGDLANGLLLHSPYQKPKPPADPEKS